MDVKGHMRHIKGKYVKRWIVKEGMVEVTGYMFWNASGKFSFKHFANQGGTGNTL